MTSDTTVAGPGKVSDAAVEILRGRVGIPLPSESLGYQRASRDVLVNYARSTGDTNPLYRNSDYASNTRWGGLIGFPILMRCMGEGNGPLPPEPVYDDGYRGDPLAGVHALYAAVDFHFFRPIYEDDTFTVRGGLGGVELKRSSMGGQSVHMLHDVVLWDRQGAPVGLTRIVGVRVEHEQARARGKYDALQVPQHYSPEELAEIDRAYEREYVRGAKPRYWEDVKEGEETVPLPKGPYTVTNFITQMMGHGLRRNILFFVHSEAYKYRKKHPKAFPINELGIPETVASVHWDTAAAQRAGVPERYDAGEERVVAFSHAVSNWMGDDAFMRRIRMQIRGFMFVGDTMMITGEVGAKFDDDRGRGVALRLSGQNQRGETIAVGEAEVLLPSRQHGPVVVPVPPGPQVSVFESLRP